MALIDYRELPGGPRLKLVNEVKRRLRFYGVAPRSDIWKATWSWAEKVANGSIWRKRIKWPPPHEIAAQYMLLLLCEMKKSRSLRLPYGCQDYISDEAGGFLQELKGGSLFLGANQKQPRIEARESANARA